MSSTKQKLRLAGAFAVLAIFAFSLGCRGFFVKPTLSSIAVGPQTQTIDEGATLQMIATGTFSDGSTSNLSSGLFWSSSDTTVATISTSGKATGAGVGTTTITGASGAISGSTTLTVTIANIQSIAVTPTTTSVHTGVTVPYTAMATTPNGTFNVTNVVTWTSSNTAFATIASTGVATTVAVGTTTITATSGSVVSNGATLTVN